MAKKRAPRKKNNYFTKVHEDAIIQYASTDDRGIRTHLYISFIEPAFDEMVDKIVYTYKFNTLPNIDYLKDDCKLWLITILDKYDPNRKSKAFSYFSVITKNWFIHQVKKTTKRNQREVDYEDALKQVDQEKIICHNPFLEEQEFRDFWMSLFSELDSWDSNDMKENERKVYNAIRTLLGSVDDIEIFNKKAIYLYLREITGLNTKQVVSQLNKIRRRYRLFKKDWDDGKI